MKISTQITEQEFIQLQYLLSYRRPTAIFVTVFGALMLLAAVAQSLTNFTEIDLSIGYILGGYLLFRAVLIYFFSKRNYASNALIRERYTYEFLPDRLIIDNTVGHSEIPWQNFYKITEYNNWFLLYQSTNLANMIPKTQLSTAEINGIRNVLRNAPVNKKKLKKST